MLFSYSFVYMYFTQKLALFIDQKSKSDLRFRQISKFWVRYWLIGSITLLNSCSLIHPINQSPEASSFSVACTPIKDGNLKGMARTGIDLNSIFHHSKNFSTALSYQVYKNTNPALFKSVSIDQDQLILTHKPTKTIGGKTDMTIRATDNSDQFFDRTFTLTVENQDSSKTQNFKAQNIYGKAPTQFGDAVEIVLPDDPTIIINAQQFGAKGDGNTDDTTAIQNAIYEASQTNKALYFPNGTYRITKEIRFERKDGSPLRAGPHLYGQSRDGVILKLDDNLPEFSDPNQPKQAVIRTVNAEDGTTWRNISADFFNRYMINFTVDTGNNPGAVGIKFYSNNTGILQNVRIIGNGAIGLDLNAVDLNGPHLIQNAEIEGFKVGIRSAGSNSGTMSNITIRDSSAFGLYHISGVLQVEGLIVENAPVAVFTEPTELFGRTTLTLINGAFKGSDPAQPAIVNGDLLFARNVTTNGFSKALQGNAGSGGNVDSSNLEEYHSHGVSRKDSSSTDRSLNLPIQYFPLTYDPAPTHWISIKDYGALPGDNIDDTAAIQSAIDAAAASRKTTVYFPGIASKDPNWYTIDGTVSVHGSVNHLIGFAPTRILGDGGFKIIEDLQGADFVQFQGFSFSKIYYENASSRTMRLTNLTGTVKASGSGEVYLNSVAGLLLINNPEAQVWARQLNTESSDQANVANDGGTLWILGQKTERGGLKSRTINDAKTEILGAYIYSVGATPADFDTVYEVEDSNASFAGVRERTGNSKYPNFVREIRNGNILLFQEGELPAGNQYNRGFSLYSASYMSNATLNCDGDINLYQR